VRCDQQLLGKPFSVDGFNPRTSCEVRHREDPDNAECQWFQSTHLV